MKANIISLIENDKLVDKIRLILNNTPDKVLKDWAEENAHLISTYFKYEESFLNEPDMDGRLFILIQKIGKELSIGKNVYADATHLNENSREKLLNNLKKFFHMYFNEEINLEI